MDGREIDIKFTITVQHPLVITSLYTHLSYLFIPL